jgi:hypothetical protein
MSRPNPLVFAVAVLTCAFAAQSLAADESASTAAPTPGQKYTLRYQFRPGEVVRSKVVQQTKIETTISGSTQTAEMTSISTKAWRVTSVAPNGDITFDTYIEAVDMRHQMSGRQEVRYNSQTDKKPPAGYETAAASVGKLLTTITIDPAGKLLKREKKNQLNVDNTGALVVVPLPKEPIAVGEPWSVPMDCTVALDGGETKTLALKNRYQLEKVENGMATISVETVLPPIDDPKIRAQLIQRMTKGSIRFDISRGRVVSQQTDLDEQVLGFSGPKSSLQYVGRFTEDLLPADAKSANAKSANAKSADTKSANAKSADKRPLQR